MNRDPFRYSRHDNRNDSIIVIAFWHDAYLVYFQAGGITYPTLERARAEAAELVMADPTRIIEEDV